MLDSAVGGSDLDFPHEMHNLISRCMSIQNRITLLNPFNKYMDYRQTADMSDGITTILTLQKLNLSNKCFIHRPAAVMGRVY